MKKLAFLISSILAIAVLLAACNGTGQNTPGPAGTLEVQLSTNPENPVTGSVELNLTIQDANGQPLDGATVDVSVDHTNMSGMAMSGAATGQGGGLYAISADFSMSGAWKVTVYVRKDTLDEKREFTLNVQ